MKQAYLHRILVMAGLAALSVSPQYAADIRRLTLTEAVHLAINQNREMKIARLKVIENQQKKAGERSGYFPTLTNQSHAFHLTALQIVSVPAGALGIVAGTLVPPESTTLLQGKLTLETSARQRIGPRSALV